ncbi:ABC-type transporter Mla subunit MlaD [Desulfobaculum xiamenense]|uniref:ABC-type transporter Mla subunit MlaD n=1 Tax=Desulfobaculum xiamenense TaxID=995050 RepID=A0A846QMR0_9BACT|nr:siphovirus Gp157 family protein [Desulfobaculum xiamenense]NJB67533.1 ABC-type transporter Mla subunit MlaD [Desulfobaculum xiamenense]
MLRIHDTEQAIHDLFDAAEEMASRPEDFTDEERAEIQRALEEQADLLASEEAEHADRYAFVIRKRLDEASFLREEAQRLHERARAVENNVARFKTTLIDAFRRHGIQKIKGAKYTVFLRTAESVTLDVDPENLPSEFRNEVIEYKPRKADIKAAIKAGGTVPGARIVENVSLTIR